ncbi:MAG TPA: LysR family transcriptional regulator [Polyangia bacterium]|nr:LysR family transcriptional regulator [Polyangia bacterium]
MGYDWNDLRYFLACARVGSLAGAGRALKVDQSTVGRRLAALEEALGARLFDRKPEGFTLTATGARLLETAQIVEQATIDLERRATGADARLEGVVRVATSETLSATFLAAELVALHAAHPDIEVQLVTGTMSLNLLKREADVALRVGQKPTHQSLVVRRLGAIAWGLYAARSYLDRHAPVVVDALVEGEGVRFDGHELVALDEELAQIPPARWLAERSAGARVALRTNSILTATAAVRAGWGIAALPSFCGPGLERVYPRLVTPIDVWLVVHPDLQHTGRVRAVLDHLAAAMARAGVMTGD